MIGSNPTMTSASQNLNPAVKSIARCLWLALIASFAAFAWAGCASGDKGPGYAELVKIANDKPVQPEEIILREGDVVRISFPGNNTLKPEVKQIQRDGKITLEKAGDIVAAGKTVKTLKDELYKKFNEEMSVQEVTVVLESSYFHVYVTGAVLRPGKVMADRPLTALDAIMESGGPDYVRAILQALK